MTAAVVHFSPLHGRVDLPGLPARGRRMQRKFSSAMEARHLDLLQNRSSTCADRDAWEALLVKLRSPGGRFFCLFSGNSKQEQARRALESALGEKKSEFEKWEMEIERKKELGGGGSGGGGGWFGSGGWSNWFNDEHFREDAWQAILTLTGIILLYLLIAEGGVVLAMLTNSLVSILRRVRRGLSLLSTLVSGNGKPASELPAMEANLSQISAKDRVVKKWGR